MSRQPEVLRYSTTSSPASWSISEPRSLAEPPQTASSNRHQADDGGIITVSPLSKESAPVDSEYESFTQPLAAFRAWIADYNRERPHQTLRDRTPSEVRREAPESTQSAA